METEIVEQEKQDTEIQDTAEHLANNFKDCFSLLVKRRDAARSDAFKPLDDELARLAEESASIMEATQNLAGILSAQQREAQRQADALLLAGKPKEAAAKTTEAKEAEAAPAKMRARLQEIEERGQAIEEEKSRINARTLEAFFDESKRIIRVAEHGLFIQLLNSVEEYYQQEAQGFAPYNVICTLTAPEKSEEWKTGSAWYGGRQ
jgi:hypothetical protein